MNTQLTKADGYNPKKRMIFLEPITGKVSGNNSKIEYQRISIYTRNEDGSKEYLVIPTGRLFSFGVSENVFQGKQDGYTFPLCLWSEGRPTNEEIFLTDTFNNIVDCCTNHLVKNRDDMGMYDLTRQELARTKVLRY